MKEVFRFHKAQRLFVFFSFRLPFISLTYSFIYLFFSFTPISSVLSFSVPFRSSLINQSFVLASLCSPKKDEEKKSYSFSFLFAITKLAGHEAILEGNSSTVVEKKNKFSIMQGPLLYKIAKNSEKKRKLHQSDNILKRRFSVFTQTLKWERIMNTNQLMGSFRIVASTLERWQKISFLLPFCSANTNARRDLEGYL